MDGLESYSKVFPSTIRMFPAHLAVLSPNRRFLKSLNYSNAARGGSAHLPQPWASKGNGIQDLQVLFLPAHRKPRQHPFRFTHRKRAPTPGFVFIPPKKYIKCSTIMDLGVSCSLSLAYSLSLSPSLVQIGCYFYLQVQVL